MSHEVRPTETKATKTFFRLRSSISAIGDCDLNDQQIPSSKHGSLLTVQCVHEFKIGMEQFQKIVDADTITRTDDLVHVDKNEFAKLLRMKSFRTILENNVINLNWVPIVLDTEHDIEFATRKNQLIMTDPHQTRSLSVLTLPYHVPGGVRFALDLWAEKADQVWPQVQAQFRNVQKYLRDFKAEEYLFISVMIRPGLSEAFLSYSKKTGLDKFKHVRGSQKRDQPKMYIYEMSLDHN